MDSSCNCLSDIEEIEGADQFVIGRTDLACFLGSGDLEVLGTPRLIAWMEEVTVKLLEKTQGQDCTSVGIHLDVHHEAASIEGDRVDVLVKVQSVQGRRIAFTVSASVAGELVARGRITRAHVNRKRFLGKLHQR